MLPAVWLIQWFCWFIGDVSLSCIFLRNSSASLPRNVGVVLIGFAIGITVIYCAVDFMYIMSSSYEMVNYLSYSPCELLLRFAPSFIISFLLPISPICSSICMNIIRKMGILSGLLWEKYKIISLNTWDSIYCVLIVGLRIGVINKNSDWFIYRLFVMDRRWW